MSAFITRERFEGLVRDYRPLAFERYPAGAYRVPMHHALKNRDRLWLALRAAAHYFPDRPFRVLDLGAYPGTLLRLLRALMPPDRCALTGVGLMVSEDFRTAMAEECDAAILGVNLDPRNHWLRSTDYPTRVPLDEGSADVVFALEIIEHMISPTHLLQEAFRLCAPGGHVVVTTPNVTRIGNIFKMSVGRSIFDRLLPIDFEPHHEGLPHVREYDMHELCGFLEKAGFVVRRRRHTIVDDTRENVKSSRQRLVDLAKVPFFVVPHLRGDLLVVGEKPGRVR